MININFKSKLQIWQNILVLRQNQNIVKSYTKPSSIKNSI